MQKNITDPIERAIELRKTLKRNNEILVVDFSDTLQGKDTSRVIDLMPNISSGEYVFRTKVNVKSIDPLASKVYDKDYFDIATHSEKEIEKFVNKQEFDFPIWFKHLPNFSMKKIADYNCPFTLQVAGCNFHDGSSSGGCWYCFVDDKSNNGLVENGKTYLSVNDTINSMISARRKINQEYKKLNQDINIKVMRTSGGEPTLVLDWILDLWREIDNRGLDFVGQIDSNLSTGPIVDLFQKQGIYEPHILEKLAEHPIKFLTALKGCEQNNLQSNVQSATTMETQKYSLKKILAAGFDIYPQMYNPNPKNLEKFLQEMDSKIENISMRIHLGPLSVYGPTKVRLAIEASNLKINPEEHLKNKLQEWHSNYTQGCEVMDNYLKRIYGVGYKQITRSDVPLKIK